MLLVMAAVAALGVATADAQPTDFGIRTLGGTPSSPTNSATGWRPLSSTALPNSNLQAASSIGSRWGRVTSTHRSPARNRLVGGVRNSWHLSGRAIDIARRPGVSHNQIANAYRAAGYYLIESLDEGDHSHFAFASGPVARRTGATTPSRRLYGSTEVTQWHIVTVARSGARGVTAR